MLETPLPEHILEKARKQERQYRWPEAAQSYLDVLSCVSTHDLSRRAELGEMLGHALYKAALQSDSRPVFQERMRQAIEAYEDAKTSYQGIDNSVTEARLLRCDAMSKYVRSWDTVEPNNKKSLLDQSCNLSKKALQTLEDLGESHEYAETFDVFSLGVMSRISLEWTVPARRDVIREAISFAEKATLQLSPSMDRERLARLYVRLAAFLEEIGSSYDVDQRYRYHQKAQDYWIRAKKLSESDALKEMANSIERDVEGLCGGRGSREALTIFSKALDHARITGDRLLLGRALDGLAYHTSWRALAVEDHEEKLNLYKTSVALSEQANEEFSKISFTSLRGGVLWAHAPHAEHYWQLGVRYETDPRRKKIFLEKALQAVPDFLEKAHKSGSPEVIGTAHHVASKILASLAKLDFDPDRKESLLKEAESHRLKNIELAPTHRVLNYWESAVDEYGLSQIQFSLAQISTDSETKNKRLEEATGNMKAAIDHAIRHIDAGEGKHSASDYAHLAIWHERYGELLSNMYHSTNKTALLKEAAESFTHASEHFERSHQSSRVAESLWKRAQCFEALNEHLNSAEDFHYAARSYRHASSANRSLKRLFDDYASYMEAWAQIEMARHHHRERKFALSNRCYEKAVVFLRST